MAGRQLERKLITGHFLTWTLDIFSLGSPIVLFRCSARETVLHTCKEKEESQPVDSKRFSICTRQSCSCLGQLFVQGTSQCRSLSWTIVQFT